MYHGGYPENIMEFYKLKSFFKCVIIEDACHAFGAKYKYGSNDYYIGCCKHADITTFSFHPVKSITTGEGGAISTNNFRIFKNLKLYRNHGIVRHKKFHWKYDVKHTGFNYRISDINCALGISQMKRLKEFINKRKKIANYYIKNLKNIVSLHQYSQMNKPSYHLFLISINFKKLKTTKDYFIKFMKKNKILLQYHYIPIYKFSVYKGNIKKLIDTERYYENTVSLPIYYDLDRDDLYKIVEKIKLFLRKYTNSSSYKKTY